jgi:hypothetical protein
VKAVNKCVKFPKVIKDMLRMEEAIVTLATVIIFGTS